MYDEKKVQELREDYSEIRDEIESRLDEFANVWEREDERIFHELTFCLFTP
ncbi:MAG: hypothetical protein ACOCT7_02320 [Candidatus Saliniplasma sp.]